MLEPPARDQRVGLHQRLDERIVGIAESEVGTKEQGGNNRGPRIIEYQSATWLKPDNWPWCAAFCAWVLREACKQSDVWIPLCKDASAYGWETWAKKHGWLLFDENAKANPGDFCTFDFSHIGIVVRDDGSFIETVEGNTNGKGERDSESGDGVWRKRRARPLIKSFIRIPA